MSSLMTSLATLYIPAGIAIGLGAAAPVGPVNLLVIQRTLAGRRREGLLIGTGAALGDAAFAALAAFGLGALVTLLDRHDTILRLTGGLVLIGFAVLIWRQAPHLGDAGPPATRARLVAMGASMAVTNPANLLFFIGSFGAIGVTGLGHDSEQHRLNSVLVALSVLVGAMAWWLFVTALATRFRGQLSDRLLRLINHGTAVALGLFGAGALVAAGYSA